MLWHALCAALWYPLCKHTGHALWHSLLRSTSHNGHTGGVGFPMPLEQVEALTSPGTMPWAPTRPSRAYYRQWWYDFYWHRHGFGQSYNKWGPEEVTATLLGFTRGRLDFTTVHHLEQLEAIHMHATGYERLVRRCMVDDLRMLEQYFFYVDSIDEAYNALGIDKIERQYLLSPFTGPAIKPRSFVDAANALKHFPSQNPLSRVWELRQIQALMIEVLEQILDLRADLTRELDERLGEHVVALLPGALSKFDKNAQLDERGHPGDPRRIPEQTYPPMFKEPPDGGGPRMLPHEMLGNLDFWGTERPI